MSADHAPPRNYDGQIAADIVALARAFEQGDVNPAIVLRRIVGLSHAWGYEAGYMAGIHDAGRAQRDAP